MKNLIEQKEKPCALDAKESYGSLTSLLVTG
jgi:hypothetical protein